MFRSMTTLGSLLGSGSIQRRAAVFAVVSVAASMLAVAAPGPLAPLAPSAGAITSNQTITNSCNTWQSFIVPDGFVSAVVVLTGGGAGSGGNDEPWGNPDSGAGGGGGIVTTTLTTANLSPAESLALLLGCGGGKGDDSDTLGAGGDSNYGAGGKGGGNNPTGGGGGGATALCKGTTGCTTTLVVAGGGGGGGGAWVGCAGQSAVGLAGGAGAAGHEGTVDSASPNGQHGGSMSNNEGGRGATQAAPGGKGTGDSDGNPGTGTNGGWGVDVGGRTGGGGGGGGYKGGGSGASDDGTCQERGGGGGGGSSYSVESATYDRVAGKSTACTTFTSSDCGFDGKGGAVQYSTGNGYAGSAGTATITWTTKHTTSTTVSCSPARVPYQVATTCTVTVTDTKSSPVTPTGTVTFSKTEGTGTETPSPNGACTLGGSGASASCSFTYSSNTTDTYKFNASYAGGPNHFASGPATGSFSVTNRNTQITGACSPNPVATGSTTTCTFTVSDTDTAGTKVSPLGPVSVTVASGASPQSSTCSLAASGPGVSTCPIVFNSGPPNTPLKVISMSFQGGTGGDRHRSSSGFTSFNVTGTPVGARHPTTATLSCPAGSTPVNSSILCEAVVVDNAISGATSPTGVVMFYTSGGASPNQATCSLNTTNPTTSKCSVSITALAPAGNKATRIHYFGSIVHSTSATVNSLIWQAT